MGGTGAHKNDVDPQKDEKKDGRDEEKGLGPQREFLSKGI